MPHEPYLVIKDTREKQGWDFPQSHSCVGTSIEKLDTGDYTIDGHRDTLCVERKGSVSEFAGNLVQEKERFVRELERMLIHDWRYILCEFTMGDLIKFPKGSGIPPAKQRYMKYNGYLLLKSVLEIQQNYGVHIMFCGDKGQEVCSSIFKRFLEAHD